MQESSDESPDAVEESPAEHCLNCGTVLSGQYCSRCGQRARSRLIRVWELVRDAFGDLFELDSRLWQTLIPLLVRPGRLTREYLRGRRARFMPPFRTYLVLSVIFFLVAFFDPQRQFGMLLEPTETPSAAEQAATAAEIRREVLDELAAEGIIVDDPSAPAEPPEPAEPVPETGTEQDSGANIQIKDGMPIVNCNFDDANLEGMPHWFSRRLTPERLRSICEKIRADSGREFLNRLLDNVPASLFILLPLMALVLKILYPLSKRYYVEHLLFVLHYHAFVFLALTLEVLWSRLTMRLSLPEFLRELTVLVISIYIPVYLYKSMRRVYEQGRAITILKFLLLMISYFIGFTFILVMATFYTAFSI
jgi:hypothetical protein